MSATTFFTEVADRLDPVSKQYAFRCHYPQMPLYLSPMDQMIVGSTLVPSPDLAFNMCFAIKQRITDVHVVAHIRRNQAPWAFQLTHVWVTAPMHRQSASQAAELILQHKYVLDPSYKLWIHIPIDVIANTSNVTYTNPSLTAMVRWASTWATSSSLQEAQKIPAYHGFVDAQSWVSAASASDSESNAYCYSLGRLGRTEYVVVMKSMLVMKEDDFLNRTTCQLLTLHRLTPRDFASYTVTEETVLPGKVDATSQRAADDGRPHKRPPHVMLVDGRPANGYTYKALNTRGALGHFTTAMTVMLVMLFWVVILIGAAHVESVHEWLFREGGKVFWLLVLLFSSIGLTTTLVGVALSFPTMIGVGVGTLVATALYWLLFQITVRSKHSTSPMSLNDFMVRYNPLALAYGGLTSTRRVVTRWRAAEAGTTTSMMAGLVGTTRRYSIVKPWIHEAPLNIRQFYPFGKHVERDLINPHNAFREPWIEQWFAPYDRTEEATRGDRPFQGRMVGFAVRSDSLRQAELRLQKTPTTVQPPTPPSFVRRVMFRPPEHRVVVGKWRRDQAASYVWRHRRVLRPLRASGGEWSYSRIPASMTHATTFGWHMSHLDPTHFRGLPSVPLDVQTATEVHMAEPWTIPSPTIDPTSVWHSTLPTHSAAAIYTVALQTAITSLVPEYQFVRGRIELWFPTCPLTTPIHTLEEVQQKCVAVATLLNQICDQAKLEHPSFPTSMAFSRTAGAIAPTTAMARILYMLVAWVSPEAHAWNIAETGATTPLTLQTILAIYGPRGDAITRSQHAAATLIAHRIFQPWPMGTEAERTGTLPDTVEIPEHTSPEYLQFIYSLVATGTMPAPRERPVARATESIA